MTNTDMFGWTDRELAEEARREAAMRRSVYPRWVEAGKLSQSTADKRIEMMEEIARRLEKG